jgi:hypothetical protein
LLLPLPLLLLDLLLPCLLATIKRFNILLVIVPKTLVDIPLRQGFVMLLWGCVRASTKPVLKKAICIQCF